MRWGRRSGRGAQRAHGHRRVETLRRARVWLARGPARLCASGRSPYHARAGPAPRLRLERGCVVHQSRWPRCVGGRLSPPGRRRLPLRDPGLLRHRVVGPTRGRGQQPGVVPRRPRSVLRSQPEPAHSRRGRAERRRDPVVRRRVQAQQRQSPPVHVDGFDDPRSRRDPGRDRRGADQLRRFLLRHADRRGVRRQVPQARPGDGARRCGRSGALVHADDNRPGQEFRRRPRRVLPALPRRHQLLLRTRW